MKTIFVLDDDYDLLIRITKILEENHYEVITAKDFESAKRALSKFQESNKFPDIYIFDYRMKEGVEYTGLDVAAHMLNVKQIPSILITVQKYTNEMRQKATQLSIDAKYKLSKELLNTQDEEAIKDFLEIVRDALWEAQINQPGERQKFDTQLKTIGIRVADTSQYFFVEYSSILYLESDGQICHLFFRDRKACTIGGTLGTVGSQIQEQNPSFAPVGRFYFVNLNNITKLNDVNIYFRKQSEKEIEQRELSFARIDANSIYMRQQYKEEIYITVSDNGMTRLKEKLFIIKTGH